MSSPNFNILSDNIVYTNSLTPLKLEALSSSGYSNSYFLWDFGDGNTSSESSPKHVYTDVGEYDVTLSQYSSSGDITESASQPVTAVNLIPNLMNWANDSYSDSSIIASVKNDTPFKVNIFNSYQQYADEYTINLYAENSGSIPFDNSDKDIHLKPTWRFLDKDDNVISDIKVKSNKIYAVLSDGEIFISKQKSDDSIFVGTSSTAEFYFVDDTPSGIEFDKSSYLPSTIILSQNLSSVYGDDKISTRGYIEYPSLINSVFVDNVIPSELYISSNGVFDIPYIKFSNTKIPYNIRLVDAGGNFIKTNPFENPSVSSYELEIGFTSSLDISDTHPLTGGYLERFKTDFSNLGGFYQSSFIPLEDTVSSLQISASVSVDYTLNKAPTRYGLFSDENSNKIYRTSFVPDFSETYTRKDDPVDYGVTYDGNYSNKFSMAVDGEYNHIFLDSDTSSVDIYDANFNFTKSISLSEYDNFILSSNSLTSYRRHPSPAQICLDEFGDHLITLHDTADLIYIENNSTSFDVSHFSIYDQTIQPNGDFTYQPAALELLKDNETLFVAYTDELSSNFIEKYKLSKNPLSLSSLDTIVLDREVPVDMVSTKSGDILYVLTTHYFNRKSYIKEYNSSTSTLTSNTFVGYDAEFLTIDTDQISWTATKKKSTDKLYDIVNLNGAITLEKEVDDSEYDEGLDASISVNDDWRTDYTINTNVSSFQLDTNEWYIWLFDTGLSGNDVAYGELEFETLYAENIQFQFNPDLAGSDAECITTIYVNNNPITSFTETLLSPTNTLVTYDLNLTPIVEGNKIKIRSTFNPGSDISVGDINYQRVEITDITISGDTLYLPYQIDVSGISGDSYGNIWILDSLNDRVTVHDKDNFLNNYETISISEDQGNDQNNYVAYGDWNGFRWYNKFGYDGTIKTYNLSGISDEFKIFPQDEYNIQKVNEDFDMTETLKSYRTTENLYNFENLFDNFLGSIFGDKYDDGTKFGRNIYEKIANFVSNHSDIDTCSIDALRSICQETGIDFETDITYPRDIKRLVDLFSIKFKKLWGDNYQTGVIEDFKGDSIDVDTYTVSADPQTKFIATERFNDFNIIITPLLSSNGSTTLSSYPLSTYSQDWGWGLSIPSGQNVKDYYDFFELLPLSTYRMDGSIIDWDNELTDSDIKPLTSFDNYMNDRGIVSTVLGDKLRQGLDLYL